MGPISLARPRIQLVLLILGILVTGAILTSNSHDFWGAFDHPPPPPPGHPVHPGPPSRSPEDALFEKLAIIFPTNNNTDMQFYRNTWLRDYLHPVCDWSEPGCKIVCNQTSTYRTLDQKTFCFARELRKRYSDKEFFIKLDDDAFVDKDYVLRLMLNNTGARRPVYISDHTRFRDNGNPDTLNRVLYGNGKFYMFNYNLIKCIDLDFKYNGPRNEDAVFGGMVTSGCGENNVMFIREDDSKIWHKVYKSKNKYIDLAYIKNH
ncbi:hypothetical protein GGI25_004444 [Coemansia spiralis]|uniref:Uncharacterized protein n=2 Tax=Coemansia TaxID=4863 RepID=A0A9W8G446_9FUNG|nr:hypothetical protein EDC05_004161 [Coemansia umbellata]KAJ2618714.1 hypothetical protein GGI26_006406 [Coemansia sp. RSA 1358]KAJ2674151.1 hypothetical protein GGI25_004444 [Coemansia spiralis]